MRAIIISLAVAVVASFIAGVGVVIATPILPHGATIVALVNAVFDAAAFPWVVAGAGGVLIGMWLDRVSALFDGRHPITAAGKLKKLAPTVEAVGSKCGAALSPAIHTDRDRLQAEIYMLGMKLAKFGISDLFLPENADDDVAFLNTGIMLRAIAPAAWEGNVEVARLVSRRAHESQVQAYTQRPGSRGW